MKYYFATILAICLWGSSFIGTKFAYATFTPIFTCFLRFLIAFIVLFIMRLFTRKENVTKQDHLWIALTALLGISLYYVLENIALSFTSSSYASLITGSYPAMSIAIGFLFFHEKLTKKMVAGIGIALLGVAILSNVQGSSNLLGNCILIFDGVLWGLYNYIIPKVNTKYNVITITYYQTLYGILFLLPILFFDQHIIGSITMGSVTAIIFLAVGCSALAYVLYTYGLRKVSCATAASLMNVMPILGVVLSYLLLNETITLLQGFGGILIILGVMISNT